MMPLYIMIRRNHRATAYFFCYFLCSYRIAIYIFGSSYQESLTNKLDMINIGIF